MNRTPTWVAWTLGAYGVICAFYGWVLWDAWKNERSERRTAK